MEWYKCLDCENVFEKEEASSRPSVLEDGKLPWDMVMICPDCRSDQLEKLDSCDLCGEAVTARRTCFCEECRNLIDKAFESAFDTVQNVHPTERLKLIEIMFNRAEERDWYGKD